MAAWLNLFMMIGELTLVTTLPGLVAVLIVGVFGFTLSAPKLSERSGRLLRLLAGLMMLGLGVILIVAPALLNGAGIALALLGVALLLTLPAARFLPN